MKNKKDKRINTTNISIKVYLLFFAALLVICGMFTQLLLKILQDGMQPANQEPLAMLGFLVVMSLVICVIFAYIKHRFVDAPIRKLREAASKIAGGDYSVRVSPYRKDGKKDEIEVLYEDFNRMAEELASTEILKTDFISSVSHEIKTPIAVVQNYASFLQSDSLQESERKEYAKTIVHASQRLSTLVNDILSMNKLEHLEIVPLGKSFSLDEQLRHCAVTFEELWSEKEISFSAELDEVSVCYDESLLELIWNNLISNAVKFTNPGGEIGLTLSKNNEYTVVTVSDNGCGMDEKTRLHAFDKFYQGDTSHSGEGNGLGLAMVKKVVGMLGGEISVDSKSGIGSVFSVKLKTRMP